MLDIDDSARRRDRVHCIVFTEGLEPEHADRRAFERAIENAVRQVQKREWKNI
jgi:hypothetical protein